MDPAIVLVIRESGIRTIRLVASTPREERAAMALYTRIQKPVDRIQKILLGEKRGKPGRPA
jgi:hypothetical protein